jgi:autotransporter-associated beta strand protein
VSPTVDAGANLVVDGVLSFTEPGVTSVDADITGGGSVSYTGTGVLVLDGANSFSGGVLVQSGTVELSQASAAGTGVITFAGPSDPVLRVDTAALTPVSGQPNTYELTNAISGFAGLGDFIDLTGLAYDPSAPTPSYDPASHTLTVQEDGTTTLLHFVADETGLLFQLSSDGANGTDLQTPACYCRGTLILTDQGDVPVEALAIGDRVILASGATEPIRWIGRRSYAGRFLAANPAIQPVRFSAGSLGGGLPRRDLSVSPEHAMFIDGLLIPARCLVNGVTIVQEREILEVCYIHVELDNHDILLAEGAPSESFLDDDSRGVFHNAPQFARLYPNAAPPEDFCAPRVEGGYQLEVIRQRLASGIGVIAGAA